MKAIVRNSSIAGEVAAPSSKSYTHRAFVCGLLSRGPSTIRNPLFCDDTQVTMHLCEMMGAEIQKGSDVEINGPDNIKAPTSEMNCRGSGTTLRIFSALSALADGRCVLTGNRSLRRRPIGPLIGALHQLGVNAEYLDKDGRPPVRIHGDGCIKGGKVTIRGDISSQFITALLFACAKGKETTTIQITTNLESQPYVKMSLEVMNRFGVEANVSKDWSQILIPGNQDYQPTEYQVEGDYSSASFLLAAAALSGEVAVTGLRKDTVQGDINFLQIIRQMGAHVEFGSNLVVRNEELNGLTIDASNIPDLVPILAVVATQAHGLTRIVNATRLRLKESNRLASISRELKKMGADIRQDRDEIMICGPVPLRGKMLDPHGDHRIAMAGIVAGLIANGTTVVKNVECIRKSYPSFIRDIRSIGGEVELVKDKGVGDL
ncbi:MAG: 3-phosphoshikimate 1-carboxyvinyltransferase [Promethearchaeia archaeon]